MEMSRALQMVININWGVTIMDLMMNTTMAAKIIIFLVIVIIKVVVDLGSQLGLPNLSWGPSIGQKSGVRGGGSATATGTQWHPGGRLLLYTREGQPWLPLYQGVSEGVNRTCGRFSPGSTRWSLLAPAAARANPSKDPPKSWPGRKPSFFRTQQLVHKKSKSCKGEIMTSIVLG